MSSTLGSSLAGIPAVGSENWQNSAFPVFVGLYMVRERIKAAYTRSCGNFSLQWTIVSGNETTSSRGMYGCLRGSNY